MIGVIGKVFDGLGLGSVNGEAIGIKFKSFVAGHDDGCRVGRVGVNPERNRFDPGLFAGLGEGLGGGNGLK